MFHPTPPTSPKSKRGSGSWTQSENQNEPTQVTNAVPSESINASRRRKSLKMSEWNSFLSNTSRSEPNSRLVTPNAENLIAEANLVLPSRPKEPTFDVDADKGDSCVTGSSEKDVPIETISLEKLRDTSLLQRLKEWSNNSPSAASRSSRSRSRRNSWVEEPLEATVIKKVATPTAAAEITPVVQLHTSATRDSMAVGGGGSEIRFASKAAEAQYQRMLRRASWPLIQLQQPASNVTPNVNSRTLDGDSKEKAGFAPSEPLLNVPDTSLRAAALSFVNSISDASSSSDQARPSSSESEPLVNLLLVGDEKSNLGLGEALDEFAGRHANVGLTVKTHSIRLHQTPKSSTTAPSSSDTTRPQRVRVRCWHIPSATTSHAAQPADQKLLKQIDAIILIYDVTNRDSFDACQQWIQQQPTATPTKPILLLANGAALPERSNSRRNSLSALTAMSTATKLEESSHESIGHLTSPTSSSGNSIFDTSDASFSRPSSSHSNTGSHFSVYDSQASVPRTSRRSSLPHLHPHRLEDHAPIHRPAKSANNSPVESHRTISSKDVSGAEGDRRVSQIEAFQLLSQLPAHSRSELMEIDAMLWRERYRAFRHAAKLVLAEKRRAEKMHHHADQGVDHNAANGFQVGGSKEEFSPVHQLFNSFPRSDETVPRRTGAQHPIASPTIDPMSELP